MKICMIRSVSGTCDGQRTSLGAIIDIGEASALDYIKQGYAEAVVEEIVEEKAEEIVVEEVAEEKVEIDRSGVQTAEAAPSQNAAEKVEKPEPRRGPGRPRKNS